MQYQIRDAEETRKEFEEVMMRVHKVEWRHFARLPSGGYAYPHVSNWWDGWKAALAHIDEQRQETLR